mmetsp:Transcript_130810/g.291830  ORF Transcript_130810/g.291830 Transcript_130810/m.291830 type:complete len:342 (-) Transcript_130810:24-1049(-)
MATMKRPSAAVLKRPASKQRVAASPASYLRADEQPKGNFTLVKYDVATADAGSAPLRNFPSTGSLAERPFHVWLPEFYSHDEDGERYAVLYMHDGQNLFEKEMTAFGTTWGVPETLPQLIAEGSIRKTIVVGVFNSPTRFRDYVPAPVVERLDAATREKLLAQEKYCGAPLSQGYASFVVEELKPFIDASFRTKPDRDNTFIMGSSMGGLISLYTLSLYPDVFAGAGCVSTHWPLTIDDQILEDSTTNGWFDAVSKAFEGFLQEAIPVVRPGVAPHRWWFDYGSEHLDYYYEPYQKRADAIMLQKGYVEGKDVISKSYPGAGHNEGSWAARFRDPLVFLLA